MIVRIFIGAGLFVLGYLVGREVGRTESVRDQLRWSAEEDDRVIDIPGKRAAGQDLDMQA